jgi:hypothetical protein
LLFVSIVGEEDIRLSSFARLLLTKDKFMEKQKIKIKLYERDEKD